MLLHSIRLRPLVLGRVVTRHRLSSTTASFLRSYGGGRWWCSSSTLAQPWHSPLHYLLRDTAGNRIPDTPVLICALLLHPLASHGPQSFLKRTSFCCSKVPSSTRFPPSLEALEKGKRVCGGVGGGQQAPYRRGCGGGGIQHFPIVLNAC